MKYQTLSMTVDEDGIAIIRFDDPSQSMNVVSPKWIEDFSDVVSRIVADADIKGAVLTSGKRAFMAGADLKYVLTLAGGGTSPRDAFEFSQRPSRLLRRLETCGKPIAAALNGLTLGGGYEIALACHHRVIVDDPSAVVGLPEVTVGLLPGSGGTQRLPRMLGLERALPLLLDGKSVAPAQALQIGMVDEVVAIPDLLDAARRFVLQAKDSVRPWDKRDHASPLGLLNSSLATTMMMQSARLAARTNYNYPAAVAILDCVFEGMQMPIDKALAVESKHFARLLVGPVARNLIRTGFVNKSAAMKLARRPPQVLASKVTAIGVLGAGQMGAGVAQVAAAAGIDVMLLDRSADLATRGKASVAKALDKAVARSSKSRTAADALLERIRPTAEYGDLARCQLVIEAVFEDPAVKGDVTRKAEAALPVSAIFATNTSTIPITNLALASARPQQFIGLHFFSPVERMPLVEVIVGEKTSDETLAKALDFVAQLRMVPILVRDARGFYTSRVFQTYIHEGMRMLEDGVLPALIENAAVFAGFPVGPLALVDEVTVELPWKIVQEAMISLGEQFVPPCAYQVMSRMIELDRRGRRFGKGFYDYPDGAAKTLWHGLSETFPPQAHQPLLDELKKRFLYIQSLETARCLEEGVLTHAADGDLGSVLGWSFPAWTGGTLSFIDTVGISAFVKECDRLAAQYGPRFKPSRWLVMRGQRNEPFLAS